jgi:rsbT co-antagonist protein RsbR
MAQNLAEMAAKNQTIMSLSTPSLLVWKGIVVLPLIGVLDRERAEKLSTELLRQIEQQAAEVVIIDITGVAIVDKETAGHLLNAFAAARLLGAQGILTGISSVNARTLASLDAGLQGVSVRGNLHDGLKFAFAMTGRRVLASKNAHD